MAVSAVSSASEPFQPGNRLQSVGQRVRGDESIGGFEGYLGGVWEASRWCHGEGGAGGGITNRQGPHSRSCVVLALVSSPCVQHRRDRPFCTFCNDDSARVGRLVQAFACARLVAAHGGKFARMKRSAVVLPAPPLVIHPCVAAGSIVRAWSRAAPGVCEG